VVYRVFYVVLYVMNLHRVIYRMSWSHDRYQRCPRCHHYFCNNYLASYWTLLD